MYQITITLNENGEKEEIININDISFIGDVMIICLADLKTRLVRPLKNMIGYIYKEQPVVSSKKKGRK